MRSFLVFLCSEKEINQISQVILAEKGKDKRKMYMVWFQNKKTWTRM